MENKSHGYGFENRYMKCENYLDDLILRNFVLECVVFCMLVIKCIQISCYICVLVIEWTKNMCLICMCFCFFCFFGSGAGGREYCVDIKSYYLF